MLRERPPQRSPRVIVGLARLLHMHTVRLLLAALTRWAKDRLLHQLSSNPQRLQADGGFPVLCWSAVRPSASLTTDSWQHAAGGRAWAWA